MEARLRELEALLGKRASFETAARRLAGELRSCDAATLTKAERAACVSAAKRTLTLLQTRHGDMEVALWRAGAEAFAALHARLGDCDGLATAAQQRCAEVLAGDTEEEQPAPQRPRGALFEGQLGLSGGNEAPNASAAPLPPDLAALAALLGVDLDGGDAELDGLEEALRRSLADAPPAAPGPPPAAASARRALALETLSAARLAALGEGVQCSVCRCELSVGDDVRVMPCADSHVFHDECLQPWLAQHNSCPVCRHELPTDDWRYEERKVKEAERAQDERGAANALRGGEFMWL